LRERSSATISFDEERVRFTPVKEASNLQTTDIENQTQPNAACVILIINFKNIMKTQELILDQRGTDK
jgi:hypothetical protein